MALDPEWVLDMGRTYADMCIGMWEILFEREGLPDGIWFFEDMGFKNRPFMSPEMYRELVMPFHRRTIDFAHAHGLPVIMHSCGFVEPLLPGMVEAGHRLPAGDGGQGRHGPAADQPRLRRKDRPDGRARRAPRWLPTTVTASGASSKARYRPSCGTTALFFIRTTPSRNRPNTIPTAISRMSD